jgi:putative endonuclease
MNLKKVGADGERVVRGYLEGLGWRIVTSNFRCAAGEMDIIAEEPSEGGSVLVFVEVKTRRGASHGAPIEAVDARKSDRLRSIALAFLSARGAGGEEPACRFDVAEVMPGRDGTSRIRLHRGVLS